MQKFQILFKFVIEMFILYSSTKRCFISVPKVYGFLVAGSLEAAYSLNWGAREIWGKGGGETLALL